MQEHDAQGKDPLVCTNELGTVVRSTQPADHLPLPLPPWLHTLHRVQYDVLNPGQPSVRSHVDTWACCAPVKCPHNPAAVPLPHGSGHK
jgi:hypothetical protein